MFSSRLVARRFTKAKPRSAPVSVKEKDKRAHACTRTDTRAHEASSLGVVCDNAVGYFHDYQRAASSLHVRFGEKKIKHQTGIHNLIFLFFEIL